jgi:hypothetical protein
LTIQGNELGIFALNEKRKKKKKMKDIETHENTFVKDSKDSHSTLSVQMSVW